MLYTTRTDAVNYLVAHGYDRAHAKVAIHEHYCYDSTNDNLQSADEVITNVTATAAELHEVYDTMCGPDGYFFFHEGEWYFEGMLEPKFDKDGNFVL